MVINGDNQDKLPIIIERIVIKHTTKQIYLGTIITDSGKLSNDVNLLLKSKSPNISVKLTNFCKTNILCPMDIKFNVLNTCVYHFQVKLGLIMVKKFMKHNSEML